MPPRSLAARTILVTGAGGFIGSALAQVLVDRGATVRALTGPPGTPVRPLPRPVRTARGDVTNRAPVSALARGADVLVHLAGPASVTASFVASRQYLRTHVLGTATMLDVCRARGIRRFVYVSSAEVYGRPRAARVAERAPLRPLSPYAAAKVGAEKLVEVYARAFGFEAVILRPFAIYGPGISPDSLIGTVIRQTRSRDTAVLRDLRPVRDFCHVDDVADAIVRACVARLPPLTILNVGTGRGTSVGDVARTIVRLRDRPIVVTAQATGGHGASGAADRLVADPRLTCRLLGWRPRVSLVSGLRDTIRWMDTA
jgi:UDP-glucose 4-epimerase